MERGRVASAGLLRRWGGGLTSEACENKPVARGKQRYTICLPAWPAAAGSQGTMQHKCRIVQLCGARYQCNAMLNFTLRPPPFFPTTDFSAARLRKYHGAYYRLELCSAAQPRRILAPSIVQSTDHSHHLARPRHSRKRIISQYRMFLAIQIYPLHRKLQSISQQQYNSSHPPPTQMTTTLRLPPQASLTSQFIPTIKPPCRTTTETSHSSSSSTQS